MVVNNINTIAKIIQIGSSLGITISHDIIEIMDLKKGDFIQISIEKIELKKKD